MKIEPLLLTILLLMGGCVFAPPKGPKIGEDRISKISADWIEVTTREGIDQSGFFRETGSYTTRYRYDDIVIYPDHKVGDFVLPLTENGRVVIRKPEGVYKLESKTP